MESALKTLLKNLPEVPGVYRMLDAGHNILYVGKAKNLKKRVNSYFNREAPDSKTRMLVSKIVHIDITLTPSEKEALLLENNLIKKLRPPYNILFRDDKSYPYVMLSEHKQFPRLTGLRSKNLKGGRYFGPYPSMFSLKETLNLLHKVFKLRSCSDPFFAHRSRPCLEYQIKRCSAPCVGLISSEAYQKEVQLVQAFLQGKSQTILHELSNKMEEEARLLHFEEAARLRDQLKQLRQLQEHQIINTKSALDADVIAVVQEGRQFCLSLLYIHNGNVLGEKSYFPEALELDTPQSILAAFLEQYYFFGFGASNRLPKEIISGQKVVLLPEVEELFVSEYGRMPKLILQAKGLKKKWLEMAYVNARNALTRHLLLDEHMHERFQCLQERLSLAKAMTRIECFDISHTMGEAIVASCVVFDQNGANKKAYRRFNIEHITPGDDYAAMHQVLTRRFKRLQGDEESLPEVVLIDGGKGQLAEAIKVLQELGIQGVQLIGVAKGPERKAGNELLWLPGINEPLRLDPHDPAFLLIQQVRNEAHRFAITGHRKQRAKKRQGSVLDAIPGIGTKRRQAILKYFGGWQEVAKATKDELIKVPGISPGLADVIIERIQKL